MPIPIIIPTVAGIAAGATSLEIIRQYVKSEEKNAVHEAKDEAIEKINIEVENALQILKRFERNIRFEILGLSSSVLLMLVILIQPYKFLALWITVIVLGRTMHLLAYSYAMWCIKPEIKYYALLFWRNWVKCKPMFRYEAIKHTLTSVIRSELRRRINTKEVWEQIKIRVDSEINDLKLVDKAGYTFFGSSRKKLTKKIHTEVLNEVDYGELVSSTTRIVLSIIFALLHYIVIAFLIRTVIYNLSGLTLWISVITTIGFFCFWYFIHFRSIKFRNQIY